MKKLLSLAASLLIATTLLSCGEKIDSSGWLTNLEDAKKAASSESKKIFLFFSEDEGDQKSIKLKEKLFRTEDFIKNYTEKYVLLNLDYSNSRYETDQEGIKKDLRYFDLYNAQGTPYFLILSHEGYVITKLAFDEGASLDSARIIFDEAEETIQTFDELLAKTKSGTKQEKLEAINKIIEISDPSVAYHLTPLNRLYLSLDKNNESGDCLKHLIAIAYANAEDFFIDEQPEKASEEFVKLSKNKILTEEDKQLALYTAGYLLASSGSDNLEKILSYFQQSYDINPETEAAQNIKMSLDYVKMMIEGEGDESGVNQSSSSAEESQQNEGESGE